MQMQKALKQQQNEINDYALYTAMARRQKEEYNRKVFEEIAAEEKEHYEFWRDITGKSLAPNRFLVGWYILLATLFGTSFALKLAEKREEDAEAFYKSLFESYPRAREIYAQEMKHEEELIDMLHDKKLLYAGAIVLGMNDALVELTGTLSGIALAFDKSMVVGVTGAIMGIAASLSMAGSSYLEAKESPVEGISAGVYAAYTGVSYILTTLFLVLPFFLIDSIKVALVSMFAAAFVSIVLYNFYISVAKDQSFFRRTTQMFVITFGVALISFAIGYVVKHYFGVEI